MPDTPILTEMQSFKCCARSDEGPATDPFGKELIMSFTKSLVTVKVSASLSIDGKGRLFSGQSGCLS